MPPVRMPTHILRLSSSALTTWVVVSKTEGEFKSGLAQERLNAQTSPKGVAYDSSLIDSRVADWCISLV